jgi:hypothetical protein
MWKRAGKIVDKAVIFGNITPKDVEQGMFLTNYWFLSVLSAIAEKPEVVKKMFVMQELNPQGFYQLNLFINGEITKIHIDDYLPCSKSNQK